MAKKTSEFVMRAQRRKKEHAVRVFGGECCICGYKKCINALEFHHTKKKKAEPSYIIMRWSWERVKTELEKCILVCANCHREIEYKEMDAALIPQPRPLLAKQCKQCGQQFDTKELSQVYCCDTCNRLSRRKCERPTKRQLKHLLSELPWTRIGRMFGVSDNAVRKWAKQYGVFKMTEKSKFLLEQYRRLAVNGPLSKEEQKEAEDVFQKKYGEGSGTQFGELCRLGYVSLDSRDDPLRVS